MDYRRSKHSGLKVPALSFATGTFGGGNELFDRWGQTDGAARRSDIYMDVAPISMRWAGR